MMYVANARARRTLSILIPAILIPTVVIAGAFIPGKTSYLWVSLAVAVLSLLLFIAGFEKKEIGTRRSVLVSVMIALCIVGRLIPFFKPVTALVVLCAIYLGAQAGFYTGALAALLSNFIFGQGPWTPFQMLAWGMIGLVAGICAKPLRQRRALLLIFGVLSGVAFSMAMDIWTVLWYLNTMNVTAYLSAIVAAIPHMILYAVSDFLFLFLLAKPFGDKLNRIKIKYGV